MDGEETMMRRRRSEPIVAVIVVFVLFSALACTFETIEGRFELMAWTGSGSIEIE